MVTSGADEIRLVLSVDRADIERQLSKGFDAAIGKGAKGSLLSQSDQSALKGFREQRRQQKEVTELASFRGEGDEAGGKGKPTKVNPGKSFMAVLKPLAALFGISLGITGLLKSSKIMQTTANAFGQILGAMVDMLLMPFMPLIVDLLRGLLTLLPKISAWANEVLVPAVEKLRDSMKSFWAENGEDLKNIWNTLKEILGPIAKIAWEAFMINIQHTIDILTLISTGISTVIDFLKAFKLPDWMSVLKKDESGPGGTSDRSIMENLPHAIAKAIADTLNPLGAAAGRINIFIDKEGQARTEGSGNTSVASKMSSSDPGPR